MFLAPSCFMYSEVRAADSLHEHIRGDIAALGDHQPHELPDRQPLAQPPIEARLGVVLDLEQERLPVDDAGNSFFTAIRSSRESVLSSAWRNTSIMTGTFIVLAA